MTLHRPRAARAHVCVTALVLACAATAPGLRAQACGNPGFHRGITLLQPAGSETHIAIQDGAWSNPATWNPPLVPGNGARVLVPQGRTVTVDAASPSRITSIRVEGTLSWRTDVSTRLMVGTLFSLPTGRIEIGTSTQPIDPLVTAEIVILDDGPIDKVRDVEQLGRGVVAHGPVRIAGAHRLHAVPLALDVAAGATELALALPPGTSTPDGWRVGDKLVLAGTSYDERGSDANDTRFHDEVLTITGIQGDRITFVNDGLTTGPRDLLRFDHRRPQSAQASRLRVWVANLTRNVVVRSENPSAPVDHRGHFMVMHTPDAVIENAGFYDLGRTDKTRNADDPVVNVDGSPGFGTNPRGRYGLHFHRNLPQGGATLAPGCTPAVARGNVVWGTPGWGLVHHDSHVVVEENVVFDVVGAGIIAEAGDEVGAWRRNLAIKIKGDDLDRHMEINDRLARFDTGFNGEGFWLQGTPRIVFEDNVALSCGGSGVAVFGHADAIGNRDRAIIPTAHLEPEYRSLVVSGGGLDICRAPLSRFVRFEAANCHTGILTWMHMRNDDGMGNFIGPGTNIHRARSRIEDFVLWGIYGQGIHTQYTTQLDFVNGVVIGDPQHRVPAALDDDGAGRGLAISQNMPAQNLGFDGLWIEGFERGMRVPTSGDAEKGDNPIPASRIANTHFESVTYPFSRKAVPWSPHLAFPGYFQLDHVSVGPSMVPNAPPRASFTWREVGDLGVVRFDAAGSFDPDPAPSLDIGGNGIVAYGWDFDGNGTIDAFGRTVVRQLTPGRPLTATLRVWDHQGTSATSSRSLRPGAGVYGELMVDPTFVETPITPETWQLDTSNAGHGWFAAGAEVSDLGFAQLGLGRHGLCTVSQILFDRRARVGTQSVRWRILNFEGDARPNGVRIEVWGVDGEFRAAYWGGAPEPLDAVPHTSRLLFSRNIPAQDDWQDAVQTVDFGQGSEFVYVCVYGTGVDVKAGDVVEVRLLSIVDAHEH